MLKVAFITGVGWGGGTQQRVLDNFKLSHPRNKSDLKHVGPQACRPRQTNSLNQMLQKKTCCLLSIV